MNDYDADDDAYPPIDPAGARGMTLMAVVMLVVAGFFAFAWYAYRNHSPANGDTIDVVHAEPGPVKDKPKDPGGMKIPYQNMSVYNVISEKGEKGEGKVEKLLPEPEEPIAKRADVTASAAPPPTPILPERKDAPNIFIKGESAPEPVKTPAPAAVVPEKKPEPAPVVAAPVVNPPAVEAQSLKPPKKDAAPATGNVLVQLAALKSSDEAEKTWKKVNARFPTALNGKTHSIVKAELPSGTFYRLRASGFSMDAAKKLCADLAAKKQPCMIVH